jgi:uncharacterized caspase-like protein
MSRLDEIRQKMRQQIKDETDHTLDLLKRPSSLGDSVPGHQTPSASRGLPRSASEGLHDEFIDTGSSGETLLLQPNKRALFIGNDTYHPQSPLSKCANDAREMQKLFADLRYRLGYEFNLNHTAMRKAFDRFKEDIEPGDELVISFSGHGVQINSELYLLPTDAPLARSALELSESCINLHREMDEMLARGAKMVLAIVDACRQQLRIDYNELLGQGIEMGIEVAETFSVAQKSKTNAIHGEARNTRNGAYGRGILFATSHDTSAIEYRDMQHGIFTHFFLQEARVRGLTIQQVIERVRQKVTEFTNNEQTPSFHNDLNGDFYFLK